MSTKIIPTAAAVATALVLGGGIVAGTSIADPVSQPPAADQPGHVSPPANSQNEAVSTVKDAASVAAGTAAAAVTTSSQGFVEGAVISDMYEVEAGKIAEERSRNPNVQAFAREMIGAHTKTTDQLKSILPTSGTDASLPAHLDDRRQGLIDELRGAKDKDFDAEYISQQVDAHREALVLMQSYQRSGDVTALKKFAGQAILVVQKHLDMAQHLYKAVG